jgi:hypothetical protein
MAHVAECDGRQHPMDAAGLVLSVLASRERGVWRLGYAGDHRPGLLGSIWYELILERVAWKVF